VDQPAVGTGYAPQFDGVEGFDVEVDGRGGVVNDEVRGQCGFDGDRH
jgi:ferredoxin--NADP+ reductase